MFLKAVAVAAKELQRLASDDAEIWSRPRSDKRSTAATTGADSAHSFGFLGCRNFPRLFFAAGCTIAPCETVSGPVRPLGVIGIGIFGFMGFIVTRD